MSKLLKIFSTTLLSVIILSASASRVYATYNTPADLNLIGANGGKLTADACKAATGGTDIYCDTGIASSLLNAATCAITSDGGTSPCKFADFLNGKYQVAQGQTPVSFLQQDNNTQGLGSLLMGLNYNVLNARPVSGIIFALDQVDKVVTPEKVYAAEPQAYNPKTGYDLLQPIQAFWGWAVTVAYSFMILIIVFVAFAMMFRYRIDDKSVLQIKTAIPGIVMAMILIPLSYPISGLFIDAIALGTNVVHGFMFGPGGPARDVYTNGTGQQNVLFNASESRGLYADDWRLNVFRIREALDVRPLGNIAGSVFCPAETSGSGGSDTICQSSSYGVLTAVDSFLRWALAWTNTPDGDYDSGLSLLLGNILNFAFNLVALIVSFRIAFRLIKKLLTLMFFPIFSPFIFATVAIPGVGSKNLMSFIKSMASASLFFIVTYSLFLFSIVFMNKAFYNSIPNIETYSYSPPLLGWVGQTVNSLGQQVTDRNTTSMLFVLLGAGLFLSIPKILDGIDDYLGIEQSLIPKALKPYVDDITYSADYALRKAPVALAAGGQTIGGGLYTNTLGALGRRIGSNSKNPFDDSTADKFKDTARAEIQRLQEERANAKGPLAPLSRGISSAKIAAYKAGANARSNFYGAGPAIGAKPGENKAAIDVVVRFVGISGVGGYSAAIAADAFVGYKGELAGEIEVATAEGATIPQGDLYFVERGSGASGGKVIAVISNEVKSKTALVVIDDKDITHDKSKSLIKVNGKSFFGQKKQKVPVKLVVVGGVSGTGDDFLGSWSTQNKDGKNFQVFVDAKPDPVTKKVDYGFTVGRGGTLGI